MWPVTPLLILYSAITALGAAPQPMTLTLGAGTAAPADPFWLETIKHQGSAPFHPDATNYKVFRNVKDFGAIGDGVHDDSDAIKYVDVLLSPPTFLTAFSVLPSLQVEDVVEELVRLRLSRLRSSTSRLALTSSLNRSFHTTSPSLLVMQDTLRPFLQLPPSIPSR